MQNKKLVAAAFITALFATTTPVWADAPFVISPNPVVVENNSQESIIQDELQYEQGRNWGLSMGTVTDILDRDQYTVLVVVDEDQVYEFYLTNNTWLVDGDGLPIAASDLRNQTVVVAHEDAMTLSLPPQSTALAVMIYEHVMPNYAIVEGITHNEDGSAVVTTNHGDLLVTISANAQVTPFRTRNIVKVNDLQVGDTLVLYYDMVSPSLPAQASTNKVVQLEAGGSIAENASNSVEPTMCALRDAVKDLELQIVWDAESHTVILQKDAFSATIRIGNTSYGINRMHMEAAQAAEIRDGRTFVSDDVIDEIFAALQ